MRRFVLAAFAFVFTAFSAYADAPPFRSKILNDDIPSEFSWSGLYIGGGVGGQWAITSLGANFGENNASLDSLGAQDWIVNGRLGLDVRIPNAPLIFGLFAEYNWGEATSSLNINEMTLASLTISPTWALGGRVGYLLNPAVMGYVGYKYQRADLDVRSDIPNFCSTPGIACSHELVGHGVIAGVEWKMASKLTGAVEYTYTRFEDATLFRMENGTITAQPDQHTVMFRLNFRPFGN